MRHETDGITERGDAFLTIMGGACFAIGLGMALGVAARFIIGVFT